MEKELESALDYPGKKKKFLRLISRVEDPTSLRVNGNTVLYRAAANGWWDIVRQLCNDYHWVAAGTERNNIGWTILHWTCGSATPANTDTVRYLTTTFCFDPLLDDGIFGESPIRMSKGTTRLYFQQLLEDSKREGFDNVVGFLKFLKNKKEQERNAAITAALAEGGGDLSQYNLFLHGPPGAGKSCLKRVMLGQDPLPRGKHTATNIVENAVRAITTSRVNEFTVVGNDELINMLAEEVNDLNTKQKIQDSYTTISLPVKINAPIKVDDSIYIPSPSPNDVVPIVPTKMSAVLSIKERLDRATGPVKIYDSSWHHVVDSGGQPQFMDILPLVYRSPSLNVVVVRLTESLNDKPRVCFYEEGRDMYTLPDRLVLSNRELIIRMCQIAASRYASGGLVPYVMVVGTHFDMITHFAKAKVLREFNQRLAEIRNEFSNVLICKSEDEIIFPINTMATGKKRKEYTRELQECITSVTRQHVSPVKVPLRWLIYQLDLDKEGGVVRMESCYKSGEVLGMKRVDVKNALKFFSDMALITYFPNDMPDLVLTKMDPLIGKLSKLVKSSFIPPKFCPQAESERLRTKGLFNRTYLAKVLSNAESNDLSDEEFVMILQCLKIAVHVGKGEYFLPSTLSLEPIGEQSTFKMSSVPLVFHWGERFLPHGFFFTVAVELLGRDSDYSFELRSDLAQWRGEIQLREATGKIPGVVKLTNRMKWIQVSSSSINIEEDCPIIYKEVNIAVQKSIARFQHTGIGPPAVTSLCPLCTSSDHYCLLSANKKVITCAVNNSKTGAVSREMSCWFEVKKSPASARFPPISGSDLIDVLRSVIAVSDWFSLGLVLGLPAYELERVKRDGHDERDRLRKMVSMWLDTGTASWKSLVQALLDPFVNKRDIAQRICEQHPLKTIAKV